MTRAQNTSWMMPLAVALTIATSGNAGHGVGNGGDHVRATFMRMGESVVAYLQETTDGQKLLDLHNINITDLQSTLDINVIDVQEGILVDNTGSSVDAIGVKGKITLAKDRWIEHLESNRDVYFLVFHEMLRAIEVNDDNYIVSKAILPFPAARRIVTRIASVYPLLGEIALNKMIAVDRVQLDGEGCPRQLAGTFADFDLEKNILNVALQRYDLTLNGVSSARKACTIVIPVNPPVGKKLTLTQLDFTAKAILATRSNASISSDATFGRINIAPFNKSFTAASNIQGRLLARSHQSVSSNCNGASEILRIRTAASLQKNVQALESYPNRLIPDSISVSFSVEDCVR